MNAFDRLMTRVDIDDKTSFGPLFEKLVQQANFCYDNGLYDACALICRRLIEVLLIKSFEACDELSAILDGSDDIKGLGHIIGQAKSGNYFKLDKGTKALLECVYKAGNDAAHCKFYSLQKKDIDRFEELLDKGVSDLLDKAGIQRK